MSRDAEVVTLIGQIPAAGAATTNIYFPVPVAFRFEGYSWGYQAAEANADNTMDFVITSDSAFDASWATTLHTNANANGLLDSAGVGEFITNFGNAAIAGGAAVAAVPTAARVPAGATIRVAITTAGTGTVPAINFAIHGKTLQPLV